MKVLDILREAPEDVEKIRARRRARTSDAAAPSPETKAANADAEKQIAKNNRRADRLNKADTLRKGGTSTGNKGLKTGEVKPASNTFNIEAKRKNWAKRTDKIQAQVDRTMSKWGTFAKGFLRLIGLLAPTMQLYSDLENIDMSYKLGDDEDLQNAEQVEAARRVVWGQWTIAATASIAWMVKGGKIATWVGRLITKLAGAAGTVATGGLGAGAAITAILATEAGFAAFEYWLTSESGRDFLLNSFLRPLVVGAGTIAEGTWDLMQKAITGSSYYQKANQGKADTAKAQGKEVDPTSYNQDANDRYINGILVTKPDGTIDTAATSHPKVQLAVSTAKAAGKPSDIPSLIAADPMNKDKVGKTNAAADQAAPAPAAQAPGTPAGRPSSGATDRYGFKDPGAAWRPVIAN